MQEFINQYGKTVVTYTLFAILIAILIGGSVFGLKGLLYVQGEKADEAAYIEEYQTDEDGKIKTDENGNKIRLQPENSSMQPIIVDINDVEIVGKLIGLYREY